MAAAQLLLSLSLSHRPLSSLSLSSALPTQTLINAAEILFDFCYTSMALTLDLASQTLLLSQSPSLTIFDPTDAAFSHSGQPPLNLLQFHIIPLYFSLQSLKSLPFGAKISTLLSDRSLCVTTLAYDPRVSLNNVPITISPSLFPQFSTSVKAGWNIGKLTVLTVYVFLYGRLYLVLSGLEDGLSTHRAIRDNKPLQIALASQSVVQIGFLMALPMVMEIGLEKGFRIALSDFILMQLQLAPVFFTFSLGTKTHYYGKTLLHGGAEYRATGRSFVVFHAKFADNYRLYSRSHFVKGIELLILLVVYHIFGRSYRSAVVYILITIQIWFMVGTWLFAPFLFNPSGFEWQKIVDDWTDWKKWINNHGGIGVSPDKSWESWWEKEHEHLRYSGIRGIITEIILALRFFIYQYGLVYHLNITNNKSFLVYGVSWLVILLILVLMKAVSAGRRRLSADYQLLFRLVKGFIFITFLSIFITLIVLPHMTLRDVVVCILAFMPTGWGLLLIAQACKPLIQQAGFWGSVQTLARGYEIIMGLLLFTPVAFLAWFPFVSEFQTRMLFNQAFSRGLQISRILGGGGQRKGHHSSSNKE